MSIDAESPPTASVTTDRYFVRTFGCKANLYDSQLIESELQQKGWHPAADEDHPDIRLFIVNSCTVTDEADRQSRKSAERAGRRLKGARVLFTGCSAEANPEALKTLKGVNYIVGNREKPSLVSMALEALGKDRSDGLEPASPRILGHVEGYDEMASRHPIDREWPLPDQLFEVPKILNNRRTRTFLKVQEGCDSFCTYCIIPYGRGPSRSLLIEGVTAKIRGLVESGTREVILTGTNLGDYGRDWAGAPRIDELCEAILGDTGLERLRLTSLDPTEISPRLLSLMGSSPRLCAHFHVSLQSTQTKVLKLMKRKYGTEEVRSNLLAIDALATRMGRPVFVGMDLITGFPGETESDFQESVKFLEALPWSRLHVFPYSERTGTPATKIGGGIPFGERKERARELMRHSLRRMQAFYEKTLAWASTQANGLTEVLLEGGAVKGPDGSYDWMVGHSREYLRVLLALEGRDPATLKNETVSVRPKRLHVDAAASEVSLVCFSAESPRTRSPTRYS